MKQFVEGEDRSQSTLFSERLDDYVNAQRTACNRTRTASGAYPGVAEVGAVHHQKEGCKKTA